MNPDQMFETLVDTPALRRLIAAAREEDLGATGDVTSACFVDRRATAEARFHSRAAGVLAGAALLAPIAREYDAALGVNPELTDGDRLAEGAHIATLRGSLRSILAAERVMLNFMTWLSGVATLTDRYVQSVRGLDVGVYDTRKTLPGGRALSKYAVCCGGGRSHRIGLYDAVLVKDNHIADARHERLKARLDAGIASARQRDPAPQFIEVEVDTLDQLAVVLTCDVDIILLDNMPPDRLRVAVTMRDQARPQTQLEASGGVNLDAIRAIAETGVDRIAVGALTHSAPALDIGLDIRPE